MEQIAVNFTDGGVPKTGLTPLATIIDLNGNVMVENGVCKELGYGWYIYSFDRYSPEKVYLYVFDGGDTLESDYDRYKFGGNELDAYSNKYSWGRTAAPYFTNLTDGITGRFDRTDKIIKTLDKRLKNYDDKNLKEELSDFKKVMRGKYVDILDRLNELGKSLEEISKSVVDTNATSDNNNSQSFSGINGKLDLLAQYLAQFKGDINSELNMLDDNVAQRIIESNLNLSNDLSSRVTLDQLLQQVERLDTQIRKVLDTVVNEKLPREIRDEYDVNVSRKPAMSDEEAMSALGLDMGTGEGLNEGISEGMSIGVEEGMSEGLGEAREAGVNAPVDMQGIAEPEMPLNY